jgi:hypothetical protein
VSESELKFLPISKLLELADKAMDLLIAASVDPRNKLLAQQRQDDLNVLHKIIAEKRANERPLE